MRKYYLITILVCALISRGDAQYKKLHDFNASNGDGIGPHGSLILFGNTLYGTTLQGGKYSDGVIYSIDTNGSGYTILHDFNDTNGSGPYYSTLMLTGSTLFGTTGNGGISGDGVIYSIQTNGSAYKVLFNFNGTEGSTPEGKLTLSGNKVYGTTNSGGSYNDGVIFSIDPNGNSYKVLLNFNDTNGNAPLGTELLVSGGKLYGTTNGGGKYKEGTIFSIDTSGNGYIDLFDFGASSVSGMSPNGSLAFSGSTFYGMTTYGGSGADGTLFAVHTDGSGFNVLQNFSFGQNGENPYGSLMLSGNKLYGMAQSGAFGYGLMFSIDTNGNSYKDMFDFNDTDGNRPVECGLTLWGGEIYGVTESGGVNNAGVVFRYKDSAVTTTVNQLLVASRQWSVYPNPSGNGIFTVAIRNYELGISNQIDVYNALGERIYNETLRQAQGDNIINISNQPSGIYLYRITSEKGELLGSGKLAVKQ